VCEYADLPNAECSYLKVQTLPFILAIRNWECLVTDLHNEQSVQVLASPYIENIFSSWCFVSVILHTEQASTYIAYT
jgi:hypothetical protein